MDAARIKLNEAALLRDRLVPMPKPPLEGSDRFDNISAIRKTLFGLLEFRQRPGVVMRPVIEVIAKSKVNFRQVRIERERAIERILSCRQPLWAWIGPYPVTQALRSRRDVPKPAQNSDPISLPLEITESHTVSWCEPPGNPRARRYAS